jgi:uncharacterized protein YhaN
MIIKELNLSAFGKFKNKRIIFEDGLNVIYGGNETGKSTLHKFIEGMLFGFFKDSWSRRLYNEDYFKYLPITGNDYRGSMSVEAEGKSVRMERNFLKGKDELKIYDDASGEDITGLFYYEPSIKMNYLMDPNLLNRNLYKNTVSISQLKAKTDDDLAGELKEKLLNYSKSGTDISVNKAIRSLEKKLENYGTERRKGSALNQIVEKIAALESELEKAQKLQNRVKELSIEKMKLSQEEKELAEVHKSLLNRLENLEVKNIYQKFKSYKVLDEEKNNLERDLRDNINPFITEEDMREMLFNQKELERLEEDTAKSYEFLDKIELEISRIKDEFNLHDDNILRESYNEDKDTLFQLKEEKLHLSQKMKKENMKSPKAQGAAMVFSGISSAMGFYAGNFYDNIYMTGAGAFFAAVASYFAARLIYFKSKGAEKLEAKALRSRLLEIDASVEEILDRYKATDLKDLKEKWDGLKERAKLNSQEIDRIKILEDRKSYVAINIDEFDKNKLERKNSQLLKLEHYRVENLDELLVIYEKQKQLRKKASRLEEVKRTMEILMTREEYQKLDDFFKGKGLPQSYKEDPESLRDQIFKTEKKVSATKTQKDKIEGEILALEKGLKVPELIREELEHMGELKMQNLNSAKAVNLAIEKINEASKQMHSEIAPELNKKLGELMDRITNRYKSFKVSKDISISVEEPDSGLLFDGSQLSMGTLDQLYFSLRIGMAQMLGYEGFPMILDEAFLQYDDERLFRALEILAEESESRQIIIFTSQVREGELLRKMKCKSNIINLHDLEGSIC